MYKISYQIIMNWNRIAEPGTFSLKRISLLPLEESQPCIDLKNINFPLYKKCWQAKQLCNAQSNVKN